MKVKAKWWHYALGALCCVGFCIFWWKYSMQPKDIYPAAPRGVYAEQAEKATEIEQRVFGKAFLKMERYKKDNPGKVLDEKQEKKLIDEAIAETQEEDRKAATPSGSP